MRILIDNCEAAIKKGSSFEYIMENRVFTNSEAYTLSIVFPLKGCSCNLAIFGNINRKDVDKENIVYDCELVDTGFYKKGVIAIIEVSDVEIKAQFLADRSRQNYDTTFDKIYINELDLGQPYSTSPAVVPCASAWGTNKNSQNFMKYVAIPWVNNSNDSPNIQNEYDVAERTVWNENTKGLSFMPYLLYMTEKVCEAVGLSYDFTAWENSYYRNLLVCNVLPFAWDMPGFAAALPHWSVSEFFAEIEKLMGCELDLDYAERKVTMDWAASVADGAGECEIDNVVESYTDSITNVLTDTDNDKTKTLKYADCSHRKWEYYTCDWFIRKNKSLVEEFTLQDIHSLLVRIGPLAAFPEDMGQDRIAEFMKYNPYPKVIKYLDSYFIVEYGDYDHTDSTVINGSKVSYMYYRYNLVNIASFAPWAADDDNTEDLNIVPAWIDGTDKGDCVFIECGTTDGLDDQSQMRNLSEIITSGDNSEKTEYIDRIYVAFYEGNSSTGIICPRIEDIEVIDDQWNLSEDMSEKTGVSLRLVNDKRYSSAIALSSIDQSQKYTFSFISNKIQNVRDVFYIHGKRYVCVKITATFSENGMSQLLKGEFYRIL